MPDSKRIAAVALAIALAACGRSTAGAPPGVDAFAAGTPDVAAVSLALDGEPTPEADPVARPPNDVLAARALLRALNGAVRLVVGDVEAAIAAGGPPGEGEQRTYGPVDRCVVGTDPSACTAATFLLTVVHVRDELYTFRLDAFALGGDPAAAQAVSAGWMARGELEHRGAGRLVVDLEHLRAVVPAFPGQGVLLGGFASGPLGNAVTYRLHGFTPDPATHPPLSLAISGFADLVTGTRRARVAAVREVIAPPEGETDRGPERVLTDVAWNPLLGGRSFSIITNWLSPTLETVLPQAPSGDVPYVERFDEHYFLDRACYAPATAQLRFLQRFLCEGRGSAAPEGPPACVARVGSANGAVLYPPDPDATASWESLCAAVPTAPEMGEPPLPPPSGADGGEDSELPAGLPPPPAPPADATDVAPPPA